MEGQSLPGVFYPEGQSLRGAFYLAGQALRGAFYPEGQSLGGAFYPAGQSLRLTSSISFCSSIVLFINSRVAKSISVRETSYNKTFLH